jgi:hypothetical protein
MFVDEETATVHVGPVHPLKGPHQTRGPPVDVKTTFVPGSTVIDCVHGTLVQLMPAGLETSVPEPGPKTWAVTVSVTWLFPLWQGVPPHELQLEPQWFESVCVSKQPPPHDVRVPLHWYVHDPVLQMGLALATLVVQFRHDEPQWFLSFCAL